MKTNRHPQTLRNRLALASSVIAFGSATTAPAALVVGTFDLTSPTAVNNGSPFTFTADTGITVTAEAWYQGAQTQTPSVWTDPNGAGVMGDQYITQEYLQSLALSNWSVPGRLVGFTVQEDSVRNSGTSGVVLFGGASGTTQIDVWTLQDGELRTVDLSGYSGLNNAALLNFAATRDVDSSFQVKSLRWEYDDGSTTGGGGGGQNPVPEPGETLALLGIGLAGLGLAKRRLKRG